MISLLVCSRISGNRNWGLLNLFESLKRMSSNYDNFEVLIKFDSDDRRVRKVLPKLKTYPFKVKYIIEPRGRGYIDLHVFYNRLFSLVDERSVVIGAMGDDFKIIQEGWDEIVLNKTNIFPDQIFIMHGRPHPPISRKNYQEQKFHLDFDINTLEDLEIIDEAPLWSRKILDICEGFGHVSFTDAWTLTLEYFLFHRFGIKRTIFLEKHIIHRKVNNRIDQKNALRWWIDRANNFAFIKSGFYETLVEQQALNIYTNIKILDFLELPSSLARKGSEPVILTQDDFHRKQRLILLLNQLKEAISEFKKSKPKLKIFIKRILTLMKLE